MTTTESDEDLKEFATQQANKAAQPCIRSMYPSRARCQMANEFRHFIIVGAQWQSKQTNERIEKLEKALKTVEAAIGDRLCAGGPLSKEYGHAVLKEISEALK